MVSLTYICLCILSSTNTSTHHITLCKGHVRTVVLTAGLAVGHIVVRTEEEGGVGLEVDVSAGIGEEIVSGELKILCVILSPHTSNLNSNSIYPLILLLCTTFRRVRTGGGGFRCR